LEAIAEAVFDFYVRPRFEEGLEGGEAIRAEVQRAADLLHLPFGAVQDVA